MSDNNDDLVRRLRARANAMRNPPIQLKLGTGPGPYQLPLCNRAGVHILDAYRAELILDTDSGQRILAPLTSDAIESLGGVLSYVLKRNRPANDDQK
jgi:hypothetical protein